MGLGSISSIEFCAATKIQPVYIGDLAVDGVFGLALNTNETGSMERRILTPIAAIVKHSKSPIFTIFQKP